MLAAGRTWRQTLLNLHQDEDGLEPESVVIILFLAALVLLFVKLVIWPKIQEMAEQHDRELRELP